MFLASIRGLNPEQIGHVMFAQGAAMFVSAPVVNRFVRLFDLRLILVVGVLIISASCFWQAAVITPQAGLVEFLGPQALRGLGFICSFMPLTQLALGTLTPHEVQNSSGLFNLTRNLGGALGIALITTSYNHSLASHIASIAASLAPGDPRVDMILQQGRDQALSQGGADPDSFALMRLIQTVDQQAMIATFQDLFIWLGVIFLCTSLLVMLMDKPPPMTAPPADH
jgi:DHA2 family multidrug resistance protein